MSWAGFDYANVIANRQKDTYVHGYLDVSGVIRSQCLTAVLDNPYQTSYNYDNSVNSYVTTTNPAYSGSYPYVLDGMTGQGNALVVVSNIANNASYAGNSAISFTANLLPLGSYYIPKFANISLTTQVPLGFDICFNANIANVFYGNLTYSNTVLNATTNSNIGNITLFQTQDYMKANCSYTSEDMTIPLGLSITNIINYSSTTSVTNNPTTSPSVNVDAAFNSSYKVLQFTLGSYTVSFDQNVQIGYIVVGGGGSGVGTGSTARGGGGGGGGGVIYKDISNSPVYLFKGQSYTITVGVGGVGGVDGGTSSIAGTGITTISAAGGKTGSGGAAGGAGGAGGSTFSGFGYTIIGGTGGTGSGSTPGGNGSNGASFTISDMCSNAFNICGGGGAGGSNTATANRKGGNGGSGGGASGIGYSPGSNGNFGAYSIFSSSAAEKITNSADYLTVKNALSNTGAGGGGYPNNEQTGTGGSGVVYIYYSNTTNATAVISKYDTNNANSTKIVQTPVTIANVTVPAYYNGNSLSVYCPIAANIYFAPSASFALTGNTQMSGNTISFVTSIDKIYANIWQSASNSATATPYSNVIISPSINSNIYIRNTNTANIMFGANITSSAGSTTLKLTQYLYTASVTFTPTYSTLTNYYTIQLFSNGNIIGSTSTVNNGLLGNIEYNTPLLSGNLNSTTAGSVSGNYQAANVLVGGNNNTGGISYSMTINPYSANISYINSYNTNKPNIQLTYAPNVYVTNSSNTIVYTLNTSDFANNYIKTITVPNLDMNVSTLNTIYTANIILGNINIPQNNANIFSNIQSTDFYKLVASGNLKVTLNNFPLSNNTIGNITMYANPPFNTSNGNSIFANSTAGSLNTVNNTNYYKLSGNISLSETLFYYNANIANITIMDEANTIVGYIPASQYYVNGVVGANTLLSATYLNIPSNTNTYIKDYYGNVSFNYTFPTNNVSNKIYTPYLSLNGNIGTPYTTNILDTNIYSNIYSKQIDEYFINNNSNGVTDLISSLTTKKPITTGNLYIYNLNSASDITIGGDINLTGKINSPDITFSGNLTTTNSSFLFNTKSDNNVKLNVNADNIDVVISTNADSNETIGSYKIYKYTNQSSSYTFTSDKELKIGFIIVGGGGGGGAGGGNDPNTGAFVKDKSGGGGGGGGVIYCPYTSNYTVTSLKIGVGDGGMPGLIKDGSNNDIFQPDNRLKRGRYSISSSYKELVTGTNGGDSYIYNNTNGGNIIAKGGGFGKNNSANTNGAGGSGSQTEVTLNKGLSTGSYTGLTGGNGGGGGTGVSGSSASSKITNSFINVDTYFGGGGRSGGTSGVNGGGGSTGAGASAANTTAYATSNTQLVSTSYKYAIGESGGLNTGGGGGGGAAATLSNPFYGCCGGDGGTGYVLIFTIPTSKSRLTIANTSFYKDGYVDVLADSAGKGLNAIFRGDADNNRANVVLSMVGANCTLAPALISGIFTFYGYAGTTKYRAIATAQTPYFTGQHANCPVDLDLKTNNSNYIGLLVSSADQGYFSRNKVTNEVITDKKAITITESLPKVMLTNKDKDPAVWGVISNVKNDDINSDGTIPTDENNIFSNGLAFDMIRVNGLGEGAMWVTNINGNISNGDYICSSIIPGYGRRQDDDILHNYTTAKATMSCNFDINNINLYECEEIEYEGNTYLKAFIGVSYHCS